MKYLLILAFLITPSFLMALPYNISDCEVQYFGFLGNKDLKKAFKCFLKENDYLYVALMYLNGEGTVRNYQMAKEYINKAMANRKDMEAEALQAEIEKRVKEPQKKYKQINFCEDFAYDTFTMNKCMYINSQLEDLENKKHYEKIKASLNKQQLIDFDKLLELFADFRDMDGHRIYMEYIDGSIRNIAKSSFENYLTVGFYILVNEVIAGRKLEKASTLDFTKSDEVLNKTYSKKLKEYESTYDDLLNNKSFKDQWNEYKENTKNLVNNTKEAQRAWIKLRDQWVKLANQLTFKGLKKEDIETSIKTNLTKLRIEEINTNPIE